VPAASGSSGTAGATGEKPVYYTSKNNDLLWCFGTKSRAVHCSVAVVLGVATKS
jgi:methylamine dehydrogenase light chain